jgi:hypothetical protein
MKAYKLSDSVLFRVVQILQESLLTGIDLVDLMRQIELFETNDTENEKVYLDLTPGYVELFEKNIQKLLDDVESKRTNDETYDEKNIFTLQ